MTREQIVRHCSGAVVLEPEHLDEAAIGWVDNQDGEPVLVYDYELLVASFMKADKWDSETAEEWVQYNTLRAIPYMGSRRPFVLFSPEP